MKVYIVLKHFNACPMSNTRGISSVDSAHESYDDAASRSSEIDSEDEFFGEVVDMEIE